VYSELIRKTGIYSLAGIFSRMASFFMLPLYTRFLSTADYGVMELLDLTTSIVGLLFGARVGSAVFYYYFAAPTQREKNRSINDVLFFSIALGLLIVAVTIPGAPWISTIVFGSSQYKNYFQLLFCGFACSIPVEVGFSYIRAINRPGLYVRLAVLQTAVGAILNVFFLVYFHMGVKGMLISSMVTSAALAVFLTQRTLSVGDISIQAKKMVELARYCFPLGLSGLAVFLIHYGDRAFLRRAISLGDLGVYSLGYKFGMLIAVIHAPFHLHWTSQVCGILQRPDGEKIYARSMSALIIALTFCAIVLTVFSGPLVKVMVAPAFLGASVLIPWIGFAYVMRAIGAHVQCVFTAEGRPGLELRVNAVGSLACLVAYATLIPRYKMWGAVAATAIGFGVILVHSVWEAQRLRHVTFESRRILRSCLVAAAAIAIFYAIRPAGFGMQLLAGLGCAAIYPYGIWLLCLNAEERKTIWSALVRLLRRMFVNRADIIPVQST